MNNYQTKYFLKQVVNLQLKESHEPIKCTIQGIHLFSKGESIRVKYDLSMWIGENENNEPRIYNIDEAFIDAL